MIRRILAALAIGLWLLLVLAWSAGIPPGMPWQPAQQHDFAGTQLTTISGVEQITNTGLRISGLGRLGQGLQSWRPDDPLDAARLKVLRYRVRDYPRSLELALFFRTREHPDTVQSVTLPWPADGRSSIDLSALPAWQGHIIELGLSEYPTPAQVPPSFPFPAFEIAGASLQSPSMTGLLNALLTRWTVWTPWSLRSTHINMPTSPFAMRSAPNLALALALAGALALAAAFGLLRGRAWRVIFPLLLLAWLALDLRWLGQMQGNDALAQTLFQGKAWNERKTVIADRPLQQRATALRQVLARQPVGSHVLYWIAGEKRSARLGYFLRPYNVAALRPSVTPAAVADGTRLLIINSDSSWWWNWRRKILSQGERRFHGTLLWQQGNVLLLEIDQGGSP